ncbi:MAG: hypothetical protein IJW55_03525 [Clostridia bacterium]|nr:hypothetical protein [Clostridia bacterium]
MKLKISVLFFIMLLVVGMLTMNACNKEKDNGETTTVDQQGQPALMGIDLSQYTVIFGENANSKAVTHINYFKNDLSELTGKTVAIGNDYSIGENDNCEILVGETNRAATAAAKALMPENGYVIHRDGNKIVILAANDMILTDAMDYFLAHVTVYSDGTVGLDEEEVSDTYTAFDIYKNSAAAYRIVYASDDATFNAALAETLSEKLKSLTTKTFTVMSDENATGNDANIYIGNVDGVNKSAFGYCEYGATVEDGNIYVFGWNREALTKACENFCTRLELGYSQSKATLYYPSALRLTARDYAYDVLLPANLTISGSFTRIENGAVLLYENLTDASAFHAYKTALEGAGYEQWSATQMGDNLYAGYRKGDDSVYFYYLPADGELRVILEKYQDRPTWTSDAVCVSTPTLTQFALEFNAPGDTISNGNHHIITLEDGSYIIIDGGRSAADDMTLADETFTYLRDNNKRTDGKIVIAAWFITHGHVDHYQTLEFFGQKYGSQVELEYILYSYPSEIELRHAENAADGYFIGQMDTIAATYPGVKTYIPRTGERFYIKNVFVEFLTTYENIYPNVLTQGNDCCMVFRFFFNRGKSNEKSVMMLGDIYQPTSDWLAKNYAAYLKSDVTTTAHHGYNNGGSYTLYRRIRPDVVLWTQCYEHYSWSGSGNGTVVRDWLASIVPNAKIYPYNDQNGNALFTTITFGENMTVSTRKK